MIDPRKLRSLLGLLQMQQQQQGGMASGQPLLGRGLQLPPTPGMAQSQMIDDDWNGNGNDPPPDDGGKDDDKDKNKDRNGFIPKAFRLNPDPVRFSFPEYSQKWAFTPPKPNRPYMPSRSGK